MKPNLTILNQQFVNFKASQNNYNKSINEIT